MTRKRLVLVIGVLAVAAAAAIPAAVLGLSGARSTHQLGVKAPFTRLGEADSPTMGGTGGEGSPNTVAGQDYANRAYPSQNVNFAQVLASHAAAQKIAAAASPTALQAWQSVGPKGIVVDPLGTQTYGPGTEWAGRVTALAVAPGCNASTCTVYLGAAGGGVWRTDDALATTPDWTQISNGQIPSSSIGSIYIDPTNSQVIYVGTGEENGSSDSEAGVGLYKSTDGGDHWSLVAGSQAVAQDRSIGSIAVDPANPSHILIGTDEARHGLSSNTSGRFTPPGAPLIGVYSSTNGGASFSQSLIEPQDTVNPGNPSGGDTQMGGVTGLKYDPNTPGTIFASMAGYGMWRSQNNGSTWQQIFIDSSDVVNSGGVTPRRYEFATANLGGGKTRIYLYEGTNSGGSLYRVDDASVSAATLSGGGNAGWTKLSSTSSSNPGFISNNICNGQCWYDLYVVSPAGQPDTVVIGGVMEYNELITRTSHPWSNGRAVLRSTDAGVHFTDMTGDNTSRSGGYLWNYENMHPDQHAAAFDPSNPNIMFFGSDGGIIRTDGTWSSQASQCGTSRGLTGQTLLNCQQVLSVIPTELIPMNSGLETLQFQSLAVDANDPLNDLIGGTQDNGTPSYTGGPDWNLTMEGDGGDSGIDPGNGNIHFHTYTGTQTETNFHGNNPQTWDWTGDTMLFSGEGSAFYAPMLQDPVTSGQIFAGMQHVWRTQDSGGSQSFLDAHCNSPGLFGTSDQLFTGNCGDYTPLGANALTSTAYGTDKRTGSGSSDYVVAFGRGNDTSTLWAATRLGRLFVSTNANANPASSVVFNRIDNSSTPTRFISSISVDKNNANHAIVTFSGYNAYATAAGTATGHVFSVMYNPVSHTATWTNIDHNIGDQPVLDSVYDWRTGNTYISTDWGVFRLGPGGTSSGGGNNWVPAGNGLPTVAIYGLTLAQVGSGTGPVQRVLYAATHGRGIWRVMLHSQ